MSEHEIIMKQNFCQNRRTFLAAAEWIEWYNNALRMHVLFLLASFAYVWNAIDAFIHYFSLKTNSE